MKNLSCKSQRVLAVIIAWYIAIVWSLAPAYSLGGQMLSGDSGDSDSGGIISQDDSGVSGDSESDKTHQDDSGVSGDSESDITHQGDSGVSGDSEFDITHQDDSESADICSVCGELPGDCLCPPCDCQDSETCECETCEAPCGCLCPTCDCQDSETCECEACEAGCDCLSDLSALAEDVAIPLATSTNLVPMAATFDLDKYFVSPVETGFWSSSKILYVTTQQEFEKFIYYPETGQGPPQIAPEGTTIVLERADGGSFSLSSGRIGVGSGVGTTNFRFILNSGLDIGPATRSAVFYLGLWSAMIIEEKGHLSIGSNGTFTSVGIPPVSAINDRPSRGYHYGVSYNGITVKDGGRFTIGYNGTFSLAENNNGNTDSIIAESGGIVDILGNLNMRNNSTVDTKGGATLNVEGNISGSAGNGRIVNEGKTHFGVNSSLTNISFATAAGTGPPPIIAVPSHDFVQVEFDSTDKERLFSISGVGGSAEEWEIEHKPQDYNPPDNMLVDQGGGVYIDDTGKIILRPTNTHVGQQVPYQVKASNGFGSSVKNVTFTVFGAVTALPQDNFVFYSPGGGRQGVATYDLKVPGSGGATIYFFGSGDTRDVPESGGGSGTASVTALTPVFSGTEGNYRLSLRVNSASGPGTYTISDLYVSNQLVPDFDLVIGPQRRIEISQANPAIAGVNTTGYSPGSQFVEFVVATTPNAFVDSNNPTQESLVGAVSGVSFSGGNLYIDPATGLGRMSLVVTVLVPHGSHGNMQLNVTIPVPVGDGERENIVVQSEPFSLQLDPVPVVVTPNHGGETTVTYKGGVGLTAYDFFLGPGDGRLNLFTIGEGGQNPEYSIVDLPMTTGVGTIEDISVNSRLRVTQVGDFLIRVKANPVDGSYAAGTAEFLLTVEPMKITPGVAAGTGGSGSMVYNGSTDVPIALDIYGDGRVGSTDTGFVTAPTATGTMQTRHFGNNKSVDVDLSEVVFTGGNSGNRSMNYIIDSASYTPQGITVNVTRAPLSIIGVTAVARDYDTGDTSVDLEGGSLSGAAASDAGNASRLDFTLGTGTIANADAGVNKAVTTDIEIDGESAGNYNFTQPSVSVTIYQIAYPGAKTAETSVRAGQAETGLTVTLPQLPANASYGTVTTQAGVGGVNFIAPTPVVTPATRVLTFSTLATSPDEGTSTINVAVTGATNYENYSVAVTVTALALWPQTISFAAGDQEKTYGDAAFRNVASGGLGTGTISYGSSATGVATVDNTGQVTIVGAGTAIITATKAACDTYAAAKDTYTVSVAKAGITITADDKSASVGAAAPTYTYTVEGLVGNETLATPPNVASPTANMNVADTYPIVASGAVVPSAANYNETITYVNGTLTVSALEAQTISFAAGNQGKTYGDAAFRNAASGGLGTGTISYGSSATGVATVDNTGQVTIAGAGNAIITATKAACDTYAEAKDTYTVSVAKAGITITADDKSARVGAEEPEYTYRIAGLAGSETLATPPNVASPTANMDVADKYPIVVSGAVVPNAANYNETITYVNGTLTVSANRPPSPSPTPTPPPGGGGGPEQTPNELAPRPPAEPVRPETNAEDADADTDTDTDTDSDVTERAVTEGENEPKDADASTDSETETNTFPINPALLIGLLIAAGAVGYCIIRAVRKGKAS
ncbi:MAG: hypothetical protein FWH32_06660 [Clostridiales bacterium]|nr:hypothetical protein [Clostridiales bacterium]